MFTLSRSDSNSKNKNPLLSSSLLSSYVPKTRRPHPEVTVVLFSLFPVFTCLLRLFIYFETFVKVQLCPVIEIIFLVL